MEAKIVGISLAVEPFKAVYIPLGHDYLGAPVQMDCEKTLQKLKKILEDPCIVKLGQNLKYDMNVLKNYGISLSGIKLDTMLES